MTMATRTQESKSGSPSKNGDTGNRPVHEVRMGRICAAIWQHTDGDEKIWHNVTLSRIYKDNQGNWARSDSFGKSDLPLVARVTQRAFDWLYEARQDD